MNVTEVDAFLDRHWDNLRRRLQKNAERKALVGRDFLRAFCPAVILRAACAETEIATADTEK
jgi:hypothetical protein